MSAFNLLECVEGNDFDCSDSSEEEGDRAPPKTDLSSEAQQKGARRKGKGGSSSGGLLEVVLSPSATVLSSLTRTSKATRSRSKEASKKPTTTTTIMTLNALPGSNFDCDSGSDSDASYQGDLVSDAAPSLTPNYPSSGATPTPAPTNLRTGFVTPRTMMYTSEVDSAASTATSTSTMSTSRPGTKRKSKLKLPRRGSNSNASSTSNKKKRVGWKDGGDNFSLTQQQQKSIPVQTAVKAMLDRCENICESRYRLWCLCSRSHLCGRIQIENRPDGVVENA